MVLSSQIDQPKEPSIQVINVYQAQPYLKIWSPSLPIIFKSKYEAQLDLEESDKDASSTALYLTALCLRH